MPELSNVQKLALERQEKLKQDELDKKLFTYEKIADLTGYKNELISVMHRTVARGTTPVELSYFLSFCKESGLNPLNKEIWCYKNSQGDVIIFTGRDGFLKKNKQNPLYRGMKSSEVCEFDEFEIDMIEGNINHKITNNRGKVIGAYAIVYIEGQKDTIVYLDFDEFNLGQAKWKSSPKMMIKKCAQSHALKEASGMTGIQAEESFVIKDDIAYSSKESKIEQAEIIEEKEEKRLLSLIENAKNIEQLKKLMNECNTPSEIEAYEKKKKEFESN